MWRLRELGIESVWAWPPVIPARRGKVTVGPGAFGGFAWGGSAVDKWLKDLLAGPRGTNKLEKLRNASTATERHLVIVLDPHTEAGVCLPVGLIDFGQPGAAEEPLPALAVPEPLTHLWVLPMAADWLGLRWARSSAWSVFAGLSAQSPLPATGASHGPELEASA